MLGQVLEIHQGSQMKKQIAIIFILFFANILFAEGKPKNQYQDFLNDNCPDVSNIDIDINSINGTFWLQNDESHFCYEDYCEIQGILIFSQKLVFITMKYNYETNSLYLEKISAAYSYETSEYLIKIPYRDFYIENKFLYENNHLIDEEYLSDLNINLNHKYVLYQTFVVNSKTQEDGNMLWLELLK